MKVWYNVLIGQRRSVSKGRITGVKQVLHDLSG